MTAKLDMSRILFGLGAALAVAGLVSVALAYAETPQAPGAGPGMMMHRTGPGGFMMRRMLRELGVTSDQRQQIQAIIKKHQPEFQPLAEQALTARRALQDAIQASPVNEDAIRAASASLAKVQAGLAVDRAKIRAEVFQVLTPEQREKALELQKQARARVDQWMQSHQQQGGH